MTRVLVTGGAGYVGSIVCQYLLHCGYKVGVLDNLLRGSFGLYSYIYHTNFIDIYKKDIAIDPIPTEYDVIIHMAAIVGEKACEQHANYWQVNVHGTNRILETRLPILFLSTCSNYGISKKIATEETKLNPLGKYAETKVEAEGFVLQAGGTVLRMATVCGLSPNPRFDLLVNEIGYLAAINDKDISPQELIIYAPKSYRPFVHITDVAKAIRRLLGTLGSPEIWNLVGENITKGDIGKIAEKCGLEVNYKETGPDNRDYRVSGEKLKPIFEPEVKEVVKWTINDIIHVLGN